MGLYNKHTRFILQIIPFGSKKYNNIIFLKDKILSTIDEVENWLCFNDEGIIYIKEAVDNSKYGCLENWKILNLEHLSDCNLGAENALKMMYKIKKNKKIKIDKYGKNGWVNPQGIFFKVDPKNGYFHIDFALNYVNKHNLKCKDYKFYTQSSSDILEYLGWIRIQGWRESDFYFYNKRNYKPTYLQWTTIFNFCMYHKIKVPKFD